MPERPGAGTDPAWAAAYSGLGPYQSAIIEYVAMMLSGKTRYGSDMVMKVQQVNPSNGGTGGTVEQGAAGLEEWLTLDQGTRDRLDALIALLSAPLTVEGVVDTGLLQAVTDAQLRASPVEVEDDYATVENLGDQAGADAVLTFTPTAPGQLVIVDVDPAVSDDFTSYRARVTLDGTNPTAGTGFVCRPGSSYLPVTMTAADVKVWAPSGVVVAVQVIQRG